MNKVCECFEEGWVTEKECKLCYNKKMKNLYKTQKICIENNIINVEISE